jgi:hypothetical protein
MALPLGIILGIGVLFFLSFSVVMIKHAARFRYLGSRTVYLTIFYVAASTILLLLTLATYLAIIFTA